MNGGDQREPIFKDVTWTGQSRLFVNWRVQLDDTARYGRLKICAASTAAH